VDEVALGDGFTRLAWAMFGDEDAYEIETAGPGE